MNERRRRGLKLTFSIITVVALLVADSQLRLVTRRCELFSERLPAAFDGFRIAQISDLHGASFGKDNIRLLNSVRKTQPDIIALTGDLVDESTDMKRIDLLLSSLTQIAPVYFVSGNHEWASGRLAELKKLFEKYGVCYLRNSCVTLERQDSSIVLAGVEDPNGFCDMLKPDKLVDIINENHPDSYVLLLAHRNYWKQKYPNLNVDAILCGHAHGGIVRLPFVGAVLGAGGSSLFPNDTDSVIGEGGYDLVVSHGLGVWKPVPRFLNNPEIVCVTLRCGTG